jgi:ceramide glucosyltransferase
MWKIAAPVLIALLHILTVLSAIITIASIGYCLFCAWAGVQFSRQQNGVAKLADLTPVSILKPLKGSDPELYEALRSHCLQDYPEFEILFAVSDAKDAAVPVVERLISEFPERRLRLIRCETRLGANGKVSCLARLVPHAAHEMLLVNDSDIRVEPDYLRQVIRKLQQPTVGLVTCLYRGIPSTTLPSRLEALGISTDFAPGVLAARQIEGRLRFGLGSTLAFRKRDLEDIGGFETIVDYLADDYELGRRIAERHLQVELSECIVETYLPAYDFSLFFSHQLRWARTIRASRLVGYAGLLFTFTLPWALAALLLAQGTTWAWWLLGTAVLARFAMATVSAKLVLRDKQALGSFWLLPLRDCLAPVIWIGGLIGRKILWRGESFTLEDGKLKPN